MTTTATAAPAIDLDRAISDFAAKPGFATWRTKVKSVHGCAAPIKLRGSSTITHKGSGEMLKATSGSVWVPCGTRRQQVCPSCAAWYADDAFHLIRAGLDGDATKGIDAAVASRPRWFVTLTAPSFGPVHNRPTAPSGKASRPCSCGAWHAETDPRLGTAVNLAAYDFEGAVLWQAHAGQLWHRFTICLRRALAAATGLKVADLKDRVRLSYAKVAEYQRRGLVHFHAAIRLDGPEGASATPPAWATKELLADAIRTAAAAAAVPTERPDGQEFTVAFGPQLDLRDITGTGDGAGSEGEEIAASRLASYVAKYATKSTGATEGTDRRLRNREEIDFAGASAHHKAMMRTAWDLGGLEVYAELNLRRWAHMLGFRGHFLTKSRLWSTTLAELRSIRSRYRLLEALAELEVDEADVVVVNDWEAVAFGHASDAERELAAAIAETMLQQKLSKVDSRKE